MTSWLYISTDQSEFESLFRNKLEKRKVNPTYHRISIEQGEKLRQRIGFNPMTSIEFDNSVPTKFIDLLAYTLQNNDFFAYLDNHSFSRGYPERELLLLEVQEIKGPGLM